VRKLTSYRGWLRHAHHTAIRLRYLLPLLAYLVTIVKILQ
jgi:hypothetical protein